MRESVMEWGVLVFTGTAIAVQLYLTLFHKERLRAWQAGNRRKLGNVLIAAGRMLGATAAPGPSAEEAEDVDECGEPGDCAFLPQRRRNRPTRIMDEEES